MAIFLNGKDVSQKIKNDLKEDIKHLSSPPGLAVIMVGDNSASQIYVRNKIKACDEVGIVSKNILLPENTTEENLISKINELNKDDEINGILVQLPLPEHINVKNVINAISKDKDVDCFKPENIGRLFLGEDYIAPCTPSGIIEILDYYNIPIKGKRCCIVGRSNIVGKPMGAMMLKRDATTVICHTKTYNLKEETLKSDIIICAAGVKNLITKDMIKEDAVIIDVGINRSEDGKICGDVSKEIYNMKSVKITPVPGGVGPMTISVLLKNTYLLKVKKMSTH